MARSSRFFPNTESSTVTSSIAATFVQEELLSSLNRIVTHSPPVHTCSTGWKFNGFYSGPTSIAYLFYRLSQIFAERGEDDFEFKHQTLLEWAEAYLAMSASTTGDVSPSNCGIANERLAHLSLRAVMTENQTCARKVCEFERVVNGDFDDGSNEWLYGRAGYLYFLRLCRTIAKPNSTLSRMIDSAIEKTTQRIFHVPRPWTWHGKYYLGAAHGTIGILCQVVLSMSPLTMKNQTGEIQDVMEEILRTQFEDTGNFPSSLPLHGKDADRLVQFCHGSPGFVIALRAMLPQFENGSDIERNMGKAIENAEDDIWERGLLTKTPCLCHGIAGNVLAFIPNDSEAGDKSRMDRLTHFMRFMTTKEMEHRGWLGDAMVRNPEGAGLYIGEAGRAWTWAVVLDGTKRGCIGFDDL